MESLGAASFILVMSKALEGFATLAIPEQEKSGGVFVEEEKEGSGREQEASWPQTEKEEESSYKDSDLELDWLL